MASGFTELELDLARQRAVNLIFDEFQKVPEHNMEIIDYKQVRGNWVATMTNVDFPDLLIIVEFDPREGGRTYTHMYQRRTRSSTSAQQQPLFNV